MRNLLINIGVDRAVAYTLLGRAFGLVSGIFTLFLVVRFLTPDEQGFYYTFASLLAMQILFELGMSTVVMHFSSHEMANLSWSNAGTIEGDVRAKARLRSLLVLVMKWYGAIAVLIVLVILPLGWIFFSINHPNMTVNWQVAWVWLVFAAAINIIFSPLLSLMEGCGHVTEIARLRIFQNIIASIAAWTLLVGGCGLLAMPAMSTGLALTILIWLWCTKRVFFKSLFDHTFSSEIGIDWKTEIWPFQWKIALSWLSGYFIFQLFTPVLFAYHGAEEAGKMGVSFSIANALMAIAMAWMNTQAPQFGKLVSKKDYVNLDRKFFLTLARSVTVITVLAAVLCVVNYVAHVENLQYSNRILEPLAFTLLMLATVLNYVVYAQSAYLRAHKEEPFLLISLISAGLIGTLTFTFGKEYGALGLMAGYAAVCGLVGFVWGGLIFFSKWREWHKHCVVDLIDKVEQ
jgi:O-antigen/teichoic acid export membrane protein